MSAYSTYFFSGIPTIPDLVYQRASHWLCWKRILQTLVTFTLILLIATSQWTYWLWRLYHFTRRQLIWQLDHTNTTMHFRCQSANYIFFGALFHTVFQPDETTTATEDWVSTSRWLLIRQTEVVTGGETTESPLDLTPALLEDTTQPTTGEPCSVLQIQMCFFVFFSVLSCVFCISVCCCSCDVKLVKSLSSFALVMLIAFQSHSKWKPLKRRWRHSQMKVSGEQLYIIKQDNMKKKGFQGWESSAHSPFSTCVWGLDCIL